METKTTILWAPKSGNSDEECQDAYSPAEGYDVISSDQKQRFAVSDGASESIYSALWAKLLTSGWTDSDIGPGRVADAILPLGKRWAERVPAADLPWWAEAKIRQGSFATLLGLEIVMDEGVCKWRVTAVGDSCFFLVRGGYVEHKGPLASVDEFSRSPYLIGSLEATNVELGKNIFEDGGSLNAGDKIVLMTDALACWTYRHIGDDKNWPHFPFLQNCSDPQENFRRCIDAMRVGGEIRNDDVTYLSVLVTRTSPST